MPANTSYGFRDLRTPAELLLAPRLPQSRSVIGTSTLKLNIGGLAVPGTITSAAQITGPLRTTFSAALAQKTAIQGLVTSVSTVLTSFPSASASFSRGSLVPSTQVDINGIPAASGFFNFSGLNPGQPITPSFQAIVTQRQNQLRQLAQGLSSAFAPSALAGVFLTENIKPTPYPRADQIDSPSVPRLAQGGAAAQQDAILKDKIRFTVKGIQIGAGKPSFWSRLLNSAMIAAAPGLNPVVKQLFKDRTNQGSWSEPSTPYAAQFPYNKVQQSESGHVLEFDDTPGAERVHVFHRSGSFIEWHPDGTVVYKNMKNGYLITMADQFVNVKGNCHIAVDGHTTLYSKGNVDMQSDGDVSIQAKGDFNVYASNVNLRAKKSAKLDGTLVDLRYMKLPGLPIPHFIPAGLTSIPDGKFTPSLDLTAIGADFPGQNLSLPLVPDSVTLPTDNPLSNPAVYTQKTAQAITYRARLFDTPEEVNDFELYSGHAALQQTLGDVAPNADPKQLGGNKTTITTTVVAPTTKPIVTYLNFDDYNGQYAYANDYVLANTSFKLSDVVDIAIHPDVVTPLEPTAYTPPVVGVPFSGVQSSGGSGGSPEFEGSAGNRSDSNPNEEV